MTLDKITITINFGNAAMQTEEDLAWALRKLAKRIEENGLDRITKIMDENGNCVGTVE